MRFGGEGDGRRQEEEERMAFQAQAQRHFTLLNDTKL